MTPEQKAFLEPIEARLRAATPGEWRWSMSGMSVKSSLNTEHDGDYLPIICSVPLAERASQKAVVQFGNDGHFIAHARQDVPALAAELRAAWARIEELYREKWQPIETAPKSTPILCWWRPLDKNPYAESCVIAIISVHESGQWWDGNQGRLWDIWHLTHWMPLPAPPDAMRDYGAVKP